MKEVVLLLNHVQDEALYELHDDLVRNSGDRDVFLLSDRTQRSLPWPRRPAGARELRFTQADLRALGFPGKQQLWTTGAGPRSLALGNAELPVLLFARQHPGYERYWIIEYDVRFTGEWRRLFDELLSSPADYLTTGIARFDEIPMWSHWPSVDVSAIGIDRSAWLRGFCPVWRLTRRAIDAIESAYRQGVCGHMEGLVPTVLQHAGCVIEDIGGEGAFVPAGRTNRFYTSDRLHPDFAPGTFVYRPVMTRAGDRPDTLWHPVKVETHRVRRLMERLWARFWLLIDAPHH